MTTLSVDKARSWKLGDLNDLYIVANETIFAGAAVGKVKASGHARPLTSADEFQGFALRQCYNEGGAAAALSVRVQRKGIAVLPVTGAVITDVGCHVWATDDDTFQFHGASGVYIGRVVRHYASGYVEVEFDAIKLRDPWLGMIHELKSANYTVDAEDSGKVLWVDTDAVVITLPAVGGINNVVVANAAAYGVSGVAISPNAVDMIEGADITAADNKDLINTKATANRGDWAQILDGDVNGWVCTARYGTWAREA